VCHPLSKTVDLRRMRLPVLSQLHSNVHAEMLPDDCWASLQAVLLRWRLLQTAHRR